MKTLRCVVLGWLALTALVAGASAQAPAAVDYAVVERGAHHRVWQQVAWATNRLGQVVARTNAYTELATGLHRWQDGQWQEASATIESFPDGAIVRQGQYQVVFASDVATVGAVDLLTPDGKRLRSHLIGLGYYDEASGKSVLFAEVTNCVGVVVSPNQVLYENAFTGLKASIRYTSTLSAFEQDVLILEPPPAPERFGLSSTTTRLQVITEFLSPPAPVITEDAGEAADALALPDPVLDFEVMKMGRGLAFPAGGSGEPASDSVPVGKRWEPWQGRQFLIEEVRLSAVRKQLEALPAKQASSGGTIRPTSREPQWPQRLLARTEPRQPMQLAKLDSPPRGFVLDYTLVTSETNFTFQNGHTYYVSGTVNLSGTTTIEAAIVKYTNTTSAKLNLLGPVVCATAADQPAIFTAKDDDSVGSIITGSTGTPSGYYGLMISGPSAALALHDCRFLYGNRAITHSGDLYLTNVQFVACSRPIYGQGSDHTITVDNALFHTNGMIFDNGHGTIFCGQHLTVQQAGSIAATSGSVDCSIYLTNCLIAGLTSWGKNVEDSYTNQVAWLASGAGLFQSGGAGTHYLAESSAYRDVGTTNIGADLLAAIQGMTTYPPPASTVDTNPPDLGYHYPVLTDFDLDGMEDGWEWKHFGTVTNNGSRDYDGDGKFDWEEYSNGTDPNSITFYTLFAGLRISSATATGMVSVLGGVPAQMALLLNDTNFANAAWTNYSATFTQNLGPTNGTDELYVGLKGRATDSEETWIGYRLTRDTNAPVVCITNPAPGVVYRPLIQVEGYSTEPLASVRYDLTNATGILTNLEGYVVKQFVDTNTLEITTNWFACVDVELAVGTNAITLYTTDRAGNVSTNVCEYVFVYPTNAPTVALVWPQDGEQVSGTNLTLRGWVSDPTAGVFAEIIGDGATNTALALVERNGNFWVENLPLASGTNWVNLTTVDGGTNSTVTNYSVIGSTVGLTIDALDVGVLNQPFINVTGTIDTPGYKVWVNGVAAETTNGVWTAYQVPLGDGGTALVQARAILLTDNGGNGSGGAGGEAASFANLGNPASAAAPSSELQTNKPAELIRFAYTKDRLDRTERFLGAESSVETETVGWFLGRPGSWVGDNCWGAPGGYYYRWFDARWGVKGDGAIYGSPFPTGLDCGIRSYLDPGYFVAPTSWPGEDCQVAAKRPESDGIGVIWLRWRERSALTLFELRTGGKARSWPSKLFVLTGGVEGVGNPFWPEIDNDKKSRPIEPTSVEIGGLGKLGSDGRLYKVLPDNLRTDVTPKVEGDSYYTYAPTQTPHTPHICVNGGTNLEPTTVATNANYIVGQVLNFNLGWTTEAPPNVTGNTGFKWTLDGNWLNHEELSIPGCASCSPAYSKDTNSLSRETLTNCWWTSGGTSTPHEYEVTFKEKLHFSNGQEADIKAKGLFTMLRPLPGFTAEYRDEVRVFPKGSGYKLGLGRNTQTNLSDVGIAFDYQNAPVEPNTGETFGKYFLAQVIDSSTHQYNLFSNYPCDGNCDHGYETNFLSALDGDFPYNGVNNPSETPSLTTDRAGYWIDAPGDPLGIAHWYKVSTSFSMWLMFQPKPYDQTTKHVPMFKVAWGWYGSATNCPTWGYKSGQPTPASPQLEPTEAYPSWIFTLPRDALSTWPTNMHQTSCFSED